MDLLRLYYSLFIPRRPWAWITAPVWWVALLIMFIPFHLAALGMVVAEFIATGYGGD